VARRVDGGEGGRTDGERRRSPELIIFDPERARTRTHNGRRGFFCNRVRLIPRAAERYPGDCLSQSDPPVRRPLVRGTLYRIPRLPKSPFTMQIRTLPPGIPIKILGPFGHPDSFFESCLAPFLPYARVGCTFISQLRQSD